MFGIFVGWPDSVERPNRVPVDPPRPVIVDLAAILPPNTGPTPDLPMRVAQAGLKLTGDQAGQLPYAADLTEDTRLDSEALCLCGLLWSTPAAARTVVDLLQPTDFTRPAHSGLFEIVAGEVQHGRPHDPASIAAVLTHRGTGGHHGGLLGKALAHRAGHHHQPRPRRHRPPTHRLVDGAHHHRTPDGRSIIGAPVTGAQPDPIAIAIGALTAAATPTPTPGRCGRSTWRRSCAGRSRASERTWAARTGAVHRDLTCHVSVTSAADRVLSEK